MKFRREYKAEFSFTGSDTFVFTTPEHFRLTGKSVNDILYTTIPYIHVNAVTRSKHALEPSDATSEPESRKRSRAEPPAVTPINCTPSNLWHLRYGHASSTTLRKHKHIHSTYDSSNCISCIEAKKTRQPFPTSDSKVTEKLGRIHSDICGQYPESEGTSIYNLILLDEHTHYAWTCSLPNKTSHVVNQEFSQFVATVE